MLDGGDTDWVSRRCGQQRKDGCNGHAGAQKNWFVVEIDDGNDVITAVNLVY